MTREELETKLFSLDLLQKAELIEILTQNLTNGSRGIQKNAGVCGGSACIGNTGIPVRSRVNDRRLGTSDARILEAFPDLSATELVNAWAYADASSEEITLAIPENEKILSEKFARRWLNEFKPMNLESRNDERAENY